MIEVKNLSYRYEGKGDYAVKDVGFKIKKGEIYGFLGPNGAGKTTVQNIMTGLLSLQKGDVFYDGKSISELGKSFFNRVGVSFEQANLFNKLTGYENLKYFAGLFDVSTLDPKELLKLVGLQEAANKKAGAYSKGMKQKLVFARSLINNPEIMFLDEPVEGLDPGTGQNIKEIIRQKNRDGATIFLTTHNMYLADELCDRVAFINEGKIVAEDTPRNLKLKYGKKSVKVEYEEKGKLKTDVLFMEKSGDLKKLNDLMKNKKLQTIHSQELTLEQTFIKITGRGLK